MVNLKKWIGKQLEQIGSQIESVGIDLQCTNIQKRYPALTLQEIMRAQDAAIQEATIRQFHTNLFGENALHKHMQKDE